MHVMTSRPHCWTDPFKNHPARLPPREGCEWCADGAASCRASGPDMKPPTAFPPECAGCARMIRAEGLRGGVINEHERVLTNPVKRVRA